MRNVKKTCITDTINNTACPHCGKTMHSVEYYTAKPIQQQVVQRDLNTNTVITIYTDVCRHLGGICLACTYESEKNKRRAGLILFIAASVGGFISMVAALILSTAAQVHGENIGAAMGAPMGLMCVFLILAVIGLCIFVGARAFRSNRLFTPDVLYLLFIKQMRKEYTKIGIVYLSPHLAAQLKRN